MSGILKLTLLTPDKEFYKGEVVKLITVSTQGDIAILPDHMPLVTTLKPSNTEIVEKDGKRLKVFTSTGVMEVINNELKILCDACEWPDEIDIDRAKAAKDRAQMAFARALARINLK